MSKVYLSKIDAWFVAVTLISVVFVLAQVFLLHSTAPYAGLYLIGTAIFIVLFIVALTIPCRYTLEQDHLLIQCGLIRQRIAYLDISSIELSSNPRSAPALSLKRVKISYGSKFQLISPREREVFIRELQQRLPSKNSKMN
jgi:membrane protein YdbS with pleckstrin-like domain